MDNSPIHILIVEDDPEYAKLIQQLLEIRAPGMANEIYHTSVAQSLAEARGYLENSGKNAQINTEHNPNDICEDKRSGHIDLVLLDLTLPDSDGLASLWCILEAAPECAVIVLTGTGTPQNALEALRLGAQDFLVKGAFDYRLIRRSIRYALERTKAEHSLRASHRRYRALIQHSRDIVMIIDAEFQVIYASPALHAILGYSASKLPSPSLLELVHPDDCALVNESCQQALANPECTVPIRDSRFQHVCGSWHTLNGTITNLIDDPALGGLVINIADVTSERESEAIALRSQRLESIGVMSSAIAHDINNYLAAIMAQSTVARKKLGFDSSARPYVERVMSAAKQASSVTNQLMTYAGKSNPKLERTQLTKLVQDHTFIWTIPQMGDIAIVVNLGKDIPPIEADPVQIQQLIMNIALNAAHAIQPESGQITITVRKQRFQQSHLMHYLLGETLSPNEYVVLEISDTGCGMDAETVARIFDPFFSKKQTGTGLGLSTTVGIIRAHGGAIEVKSEIGQGTTFRILFPICNALSEIEREYCLPVSASQLEQIKTKVH